MEFHDVLHGSFDLGLGENYDLIKDLLACPELQRLRHMRQMNFDVPSIQELGTSKRLPHSVGVAYLTERLSLKWLSNSSDKKALLAAALLHDAAIPPYGHLVETYLKRRHPDFSHESILEELLLGTYHWSNKYHQLLPGQSLSVGAILDRHCIDRHKVLEIVRPNSGEVSAISADIDLDNIDNIHRMAVMMGWKGVKNNIQALITHTKLGNDLSLTFDNEAEKYICMWQTFRQRLYTLIIADPTSVAHNAFQSRLVQTAIENEIITPELWFLNEPIFEERLRNNLVTKDMGLQVLSGSRYALIDYIWFKSLIAPPHKDWANMEEILRPKLPELGANQYYFFWVEKKLVCRAVSYKTTDGKHVNLGQNSASLFIAKIHTDSDRGSLRKSKKSEKEEWRESVEEIVRNTVGQWNYNVAYPENYNGDYFSASEKNKQLGLY